MAQKLTLASQQNGSFFDQLKADKDRQVSLVAGRRATIRFANVKLQ
jgi:hypothetical protein